MSDDRAGIVRRVVRSLEETRDPERLVWSYFESDRDALIEATRETLEATREDTSPEKIEEAVERELIEGLRYPPVSGRGFLPWLWIRRRVAAACAVAIALAALALVLL